MNALSLLHEEITQACPNIHKVRLKAVMDATQALCLHQRATLTGLGRTLSSRIKTKHCIKRMDRLLGNPILHMERADIYRVLADKLIASHCAPLLLVDWSQINEESAFHIIRASIPMDGRALTIYEEVHPKKTSNSPKVHQAFLEKLSTIIKEHTTPIIVSDAGFRTPWFKAVKSFGWHWVGRVRGEVVYKMKQDAPWLPCKQLYSQSTPIPAYVGHITLTKTNPMRCYAHLYRKLPQGRKKRTQGKRVSKRTNSRDYSRREREPWFLISDIPISRLSSQQIVNIYQSRMQIEESFRDNKNQRIGLSLKETKSLDTQRLQVLLLLVTLATLALWLIGKTATQQGLHQNYQANTVRTRPILSLFNLGLQVLRKEPENIDMRSLALVFQLLHKYTFSEKST